MNKKLQRTFVPIITVATILVSYASEAIPLNGLSNKAIADRFDVYFVPAPYVFSIWGLIYLALLAYSIYQLLPRQMDNPRLDAIIPWALLSGIANMSWIFFWHYEQFYLAFLAMLTLLVSLIEIYIRLGIQRNPVSAGEKWAVQVPFSIYLGWITVATIANATSLLDYMNWTRFGLSDVQWTWIILAVVVVLTTLVNYYRKDLAYTLVILWALAGIATKFTAEPLVAIPTWFALGLTALSWLLSQFLHEPSLRLVDLAGNE